MTIETFEMTYRYVGESLLREDVATIFTGFPERKDRLPNLIKIIVEQGKYRMRDRERKEKKGWTELRSRCKENLIVLSLKED